MVVYLALNELNDTILYNSNLKTATYKILLEDLNIDLFKSVKVKDDFLLIMAQFGFHLLFKTLLDRHQILVLITYC